MLVNINKISWTTSQDPPLHPWHRKPVLLWLISLAVINPIFRYKLHQWAEKVRVESSSHAPTIDYNSLTAVFYKFEPTLSKIETINSRFKRAMLELSNPSYNHHSETNIASELRKQRLTKMFVHVQFLKFRSLNSELLGAFVGTVTWQAWYVGIKMHFPVHNFF
jgi:hypothetical protein